MNEEHDNKDSACTACACPCDEHKTHTCDVQEGTEKTEAAGGAEHKQGGVCGADGRCG